MKKKKYRDEKKKLIIKKKMIGIIRAILAGLYKFYI